MSSDVSKEEATRTYVLRSSWTLPAFVTFGLIAASVFLAWFAEGILCFAGPALLCGAYLTFRFVSEYLPRKRRIVVSEISASLPGAEGVELYFPFVGCERYAGDSGFQFVIETAGRQQVSITPNSTMARSRLKELLTRMERRIEEERFITREDFVAICELVTRPPNTF